MKKWEWPGWDDPRDGLCWFANNIIDAGPCDGALVRCHLIPRSLLRREFPKDRHPMKATKIARDPASWVWGCGGPMGNAGHHGQLDTSRTLKIPRHLLPAETIALADRHGLSWWIDREYGSDDQEAAA